MSQTVQPTQIKNDAFRRPKVILIVEDNPIHRRLMVSELQGRYNIETASDSQTAMEYLSSGWASQINLVILDLRLPRLEGETPSLDEGYRVLRNYPRRPEQVVLVVTGELTEEGREELESLGVQRFFEKPFSPMKFRKYIDDLLGEGESTSHNS